MKHKKKVKLPPEVAKGFRRFRRRFRFFSLNRGLLLTLASCAIWVLLAVLVDRIFRLPPVWRMGLLVLTVATTAFILLYYGLRPLIRRLYNRRVAARVGEAMPEVHDELVSAVELSDERGFAASEGVSESLLRDALEDINERVAAADFRRPVRLRRLLYPAVVVAAVVALGFAGYHFRPEAFTNAVNRLVSPLKNIPFFCYTKLAVLPGDVVMARGSEESVFADVTGRIPEGALAEVLMTSAKKQWFGLKRDEKSVSAEAAKFLWETGPLFETLHYRIYAGDAISTWYRFKVVPPPTVIAKGATVHYPDYAEAEPKRIESLQGPLDVVRDSHVQLHIKSTSAVDAWLLRDGKEIPLEKEDSGGFSSSLLLAAGEAEYAVGLRDENKIENRETDRVHIRAIDDPFPSVMVEKPGRNLTLLTHEFIEVTCQAKDNFGLRGLDLVFTKFVNDEAGAPVITALAEGKATTGALIGKTVLRISEIGVLPGEQLHYWAESSDFAGDKAARIKASDVFRINVLDPQEFIRMILADLERLRLDILRLARSERVEAASSKSLAELEAKALASTKTAKAARTGARRQVQIAHRTEDVAKRVEMAVAQLTRVPDISTKLVTDVEIIARALRSVESTQMANAVKELAGAADAVGADRRRPKLLKAEVEQTDAAQRLESLAKALKEASQQGVLENLIATAERLAKMQRDLAERTATLAPETAGMSQEQLSEQAAEQVSDLAAGEGDIAEGIEQLQEDLTEGAASLAFSSPSAAEAAAQAAQALASQGVPAQASSAQEMLKRNRLFGSMPDQEAVAEALESLAEELSEQLDTSSGLEAVEAALTEFVRRQRVIITEIEGRMDPKTPSTPVKDTASAQASLKREVLEQATALDLLAMELAGFDSLTARKMRQAGGAMGEAYGFLRKADDKQALPPAKRALELLVSAQEVLEMEAGEFGEAEMAGGMTQAMLALHKILLGQKRVNNNTQDTDKARRSYTKAKVKRVTKKIANSQGEVREDTLGLADGVSGLELDTDILDRAAVLMNASRVALDATDTSEETRIVQRQIMALLEHLVSDMDEAMMGMGPPGASGSAMAGMMMNGMSGQGYFGGDNAEVPLTQVYLGKQDWKDIRSEYEGKIVGGWEEVVAPEFRGLLETYFDALRGDTFPLEGE